MVCAVIGSGRMECAMKSLLWTIIVILSAAVIFLYRSMKYYRDRTDEEIDKVQKGLEFYDILVRWLGLRQAQRTLAEYFAENGYQAVAIYGMKEIGRLLLNELRLEGIDVRYAIDRDADEISGDISVIKPSCNLPEADVIVVTASHYFDSIYLELREFTEAEIVPIEDVLWSI